MTGFVSGYMANVPAEWQPKLGGPAITGQCCLPIVWRTSWGPSAFAWNPQQLSSTSLVPATPLLYYPGGHHTLGHWDGSGPAYGGTTQINGVAIIAGTRTVLYFGRNGVGPFCYGNGTSDQSLVGTLGPDNEVYCYDPSSPAKGQHAYPYQYQIWAYDLNDLAAVKAGTKQPWDVVPYGVWPFALPTPEPMVRIGGIGYDSSRQIIYVSQLLADQDGYGYRPLIHALKIGNATGSPMPTPSPTPAPPAPAPSTRVTTVAIAADRVAPQPPGTTVTFTATPSGGTSVQYKWWTYDGAWKPVGGWTSSNTFAWTPATAFPAGRITVWAKSAANTADEAEASVAMDFVISGTAAAPPRAAAFVCARHDRRHQRQPDGAPATGHDRDFHRGGIGRYRAAAIQVVDLRRRLDRRRGRSARSRGPRDRLSGGASRVGAQRANTTTRLRRRRPWISSSPAAAPARRTHPSHLESRPCHRPTVGQRREHGHVQRGANRRRAAPIQVVDLRRRLASGWQLDNVEHVRVDPGHDLSSGRVTVWARSAGNSPTRPKPRRPWTSSSRTAVTTPASAPSGTPRA